MVRAEDGIGGDRAIYGYCEVDGVVVEFGADVVGITACSLQLLKVCTPRSTIKDTISECRNLPQTTSN